ncbi:hypothetical protein [Paenibacillus sp. Soil750]|nr:hypothetical protein [Paenibacillus sp. Soil750]
MTISLYLIGVNLNKRIEAGRTADRKGPSIILATASELSLREEL